MIYVGFSRPIKFKLFSFLIRVFQYWSAYSHAYIRFYDEYTERWIIFEASHGEVHLITDKNWSGNNIKVKEVGFDLSDKYRRELIKFAIDNLQKPYSIKNILSIFINRITGFRMFADGPKAFICSELIALALDNKITLRKPLDLVTPKDLYEAVSRG